MTREGGREIRMGRVYPLPGIRTGARSASFGSSSHKLLWRTRPLFLSLFPRSQARRATHFAAVARFEATIRAADAWENLGFRFVTGESDADHRGDFRRQL